MPLISAPESSLSFSDSRCLLVTAVMNSSPESQTWDASSPTGCISKEVFRQFLKLWALFCTSVGICSCHRISCFHSCKNPCFRTQVAPTYTKWGARPPAQRLAEQEPGHKSQQRTTEVCSTGITLFPLRCGISKTNLVHFRARSKSPMKRPVRLVLPGIWHPPQRTATKVKMGNRGRTSGTWKTKGNNEAFALEPENCVVQYLLKWAAASKIWHGTFIHI